MQALRVQALALADRTGLHLQGRVAEAENIVKAGLPEDQATTNVAYLKRLLSRKENAQASVDKRLAKSAGALRLER